MSKEVKKQEGKQPELKSGATAHSSSNYPEQERESLRLGHEAATRETVKDAVEDKKAHESARQGRFQATGEPSQAPCYEDVAE